LTLDEGLTRQIKALAQAEGATLYMVLLAVFQVLLHRYTGQEDIVLGSPTAGRSRPEFGGIIGYFVNPLVLRANLSGDPAFTDFLAQVRHIVLGALDHQDYPFPLLVDQLQPERDSSRSPLFQVTFALEKPHRNEHLSGFVLGQSEAQVDVGGLQLQPYALEQQAAQFDLTLMAADVNGSLFLSWQYNTDLFDAATIRRMGEHFQTLLQAIVINPEKRLSGLSLLTDRERRQLLADWNDTSRDYPQERCVHQLFETQTEQTPDAVAVIFEHERLTYGELNRQANQLAHYLRQCGVRPEVRVGIFMERSIEMLVGLLGVLKAGGAYVPLDPAYPKDRLAFMLGDAQTAVLLTRQSLAEMLPPHNARLVCLDSDREEMAQQSPLNPVSEVLPENLIYVIYTSGSTGRPKGAMLTHKGIVNCILWMQETYGLTCDDRFLHKASLGFDPSVWELFWPLMVGASVSIAGPGVHQDSDYLIETIKKDQVTIIYFVPSMLNVFLEAEGLESATSLRRVICGGESLSVETMRRFFSRSGAELHHSYGPTETSIAVSEWSCEPDSERQLASIGRPLANTQVYLLDRQLNPVPIGAQGELYVGGDCLGRGYLFRAELTAERFIPNPFGDTAGARLYKTGDLGRYLPDGNIEFLGRTDNQIKVRGFRIEPGEIEAMLGQHPALRESVVIAREDVAGEKRLVAYVILHPKQSLTSGQMRAFLKERIPEHMIPSSFVLLDALPLMPNGKVDFRALPAPERSRQGATESITAPRSAEESLLVAIWSQALGVEQLGIHDNFFELGGDSILGMQVVARANRAGLRLAPKHIFQHQTITELAAVAAHGCPLQAEQDVLTGPLPLTPIQHRFFEQNLPDPHHFNQTVLLRARQPLDPTLMERVVQRMLVQHDALRLRFVPQETGWEQFYARPDGDAPFVYVNLSSLPETAQEAAFEKAAANLQTSLSLSDGPLMRVALFDFGVGRPNRLLLIIHHLAVDGVSWRILLEDIQTAYQQLSCGEEIELAPKTTSFKHWAERLTERARSGMLQPQLDYWLAKTRKTVARFPVDQAGAANSVAAARSLRMSLSAEETRALIQHVPTVYRTQINDVLLTALVQSFALWSGTNSLLVELEGHGREAIADDVNVSRTVGWFTSIFPVLLELRESSHPGETLKSVKEQLRAVPQRGIGYGLLRYLSGTLEVVNGLRSLPQAEVSFNYLGQFDQTLSESSLFELAEEAGALSRSERGTRAHLLEINSLITGGQLRVDWTYSENIHHRETIKRLAQSFMESLRILIAHCQSSEAGGYTPSDFPLLRLSQAELDRAFTIVESRGNEQRARGYIEDAYPLSPMQEGMLFHSLYAPESSLYLTQLACSLTGLNALAFERAWQQVLARHPVLRTSFAWTHLEKPIQVVGRQVHLPWEQHDWRHLSARERAEKFKAYLTDDRRRGIDLSTAPAMRISLIRLSDDAYKFIWSHHHLLLDGWAMSLLLKEVFAFYEAFCQERTISLEPAPTYREFIAWLQQQDMSTAEAFWRTTLHGFTTPTSLRLRRLSGQAPGDESYEQEQTRLSTSTTSALQSLARQHQLTLNTLVQGAWALLLSRYSDREDVVFGITVAGRPADLAGVEQMVGLFINTLPLRAQANPDESLLPWLAKLQEQQVDMRQYEYSPLVEVQAWSDLPGGARLFETILAFENYPLDISLGRRERNPEISDIHHVERNNYPLAVVVWPGPELSLQIIYDSARYEALTISRLLRHFAKILGSFAARPDARLGELEMLSEEENLLLEKSSTIMELEQSFSF
jgi:amino acid adenylation domain-containing protein/non-ribosomal peptide synthase protein (TIGR01720 family)